MLKQSVTYTDPLTDEKVTETLYFNFSKAELAEIIIVDPEFGDKLKGVAQRQDPRELMDTVKDMIRRSYGEVIEVNGRKTFHKSEEASDLFMTTEAYSVFFMGFLEEPQKIADFVNGIMPQELMDRQFEKQVPRPVPQDRLPKQTKTIENVELPEITEYSAESTKTTRLAELQSRPVSDLSVEEFIELKDLQD